MQDAKTAIMDAAERRIQVGGFGGFSFRDIASDVGVKSSSVHYHFPTKDNLTAAVVRRWTEAASQRFDAQLREEPDPARAWAKSFRGTAFSKGRICPCTVLAAASQDLPAEVATEVKHFFTMCIDKLLRNGVAQIRADQVLATLVGALVVANALSDSTVYDRAVSDILS